MHDSCFWQCVKHVSHKVTWVDTVQLQVHYLRVCMYFQKTECMDIVVKRCLLIKTVNSREGLTCCVALLDEVK